MKLAALWFKIDNFLVDFLKKSLHCLYARLVKLMHPSVKWTQKVGNFAALTSMLLPTRRVE